MYAITNKIESKLLVNSVTTLIIKYNVCILQVYLQIHQYHDDLLHLQQFMLFMDTIGSSNFVVNRRTYVYIASKTKRYWSYGD